MSRITPTLKLVCKECGWRPMESETMEVVKAHFEQHHAGRPVTLDLSAVCVCGKEMRFTHTVRQGRMLQDNFTCDCGNVGYINRSDNT
jgi:hypothetical protein